MAVFSRGIAKIDDKYTVKKNLLMNTLIITHLLNDHQYAAIFGKTLHSKLFEYLLYYLPEEEKKLVEFETGYFYPLPVAPCPSDESNPDAEPEYTNEEVIDGALDEFMYLHDTAVEAKVNVSVILMVATELYDDLVCDLRIEFNSKEIRDAWRLMEVDLPEVVLPANLYHLPRHILSEKYELPPIECISYQTALDYVLLNLSDVSVRRFFNHERNRNAKRFKKKPGVQKPKSKRKRKVRHYKKGCDTNSTLYFAYKGSNN